MKIIFNDTSGLKLMSPNPEYDPFMVAEKDVPAGIMFKIYDESELPLNEHFESWVCEINESNKDGVGLTKEQFYDKYPHLQGWAVQ